MVPTNKAANGNVMNGSVDRIPLKRLSFDSGLEAAGGFGLYQKLLCLFVFLNISYIACMYWTQIFILTTPKHWCKPSLPSEFIVKADNCNIYLNQSIFSSNADEETFANFSGSIQRYLKSTVNDLGTQDDRIACPNGWEYDFSELFPTYATENNWVCQNSWRTYGVHTAFWIGSATGFVVWGLVADKYGRRIALYVLYFFNGVANALTICAPNGSLFTVIRFIIGVTMYPTTSISYTIAIEYVTANKRSIVGAINIAGWFIGFSTFPWLAAYIRDWRIVTLCPSVVAFMLFLAMKWIPESASWLLTCGKKEETKKILMRIAAINSSNPPEYFEKHEITAGNTEQTISQEGFFQSTMALIKFPVLRGRTLKILFLAFAAGFFCYGNIFHISKLDVDFFLSYSIVGTLEFPACLYSIIALDRVGRRWSLFGTYTIGGALAIITFFLAKVSSNALFILDISINLLFIMSYNLLFQYAAELFPTAIRGRGFCLQRVFGELGGCAGSLTVYLSEINPLLPQLVFGVLSLLSAVVVVLLPETAKQTLPITIEDGEKFGTDQKFCFCPCISQAEDEDNEQEVDKSGSTARL